MNTTIACVNFFSGSGHDVAMVQGGNPGGVRDHESSTITPDQYHYCEKTLEPAGSTPFKGEMTAAPQHNAASTPTTFDARDSPRRDRLHRPIFVAPTLRSTTLCAASGDGPQRSFTSTGPSPRTLRALSPSPLSSRAHSATTCHTPARMYSLPCPSRGFVARATGPACGENPYSVVRLIR